jgi:hypothetical protein
MAGHPVISLVAGHAFSGGFLTHGYQANRILAFDDAGIVIHAMHNISQKQADEDREHRIEKNQSIASRRGVMDNLNVRNLIVLVMDFAIPCALFYMISRTSWPVLVEQSEPAVMMAVVFVALYAASYVWARRSLKMSIFRCLCTCTDRGLFQILLP